MSKVPTPGKATEPQTYQVLDTQGSLSPLGQLLRCAQDPDDASAVLVLRNRQGALLSVTIVRIPEIEHDRKSGAVVFGGYLGDGRRIDGFVYATAKTDDPEVFGNATIHE